MEITINLLQPNLVENHIIKCTVYECIGLHTHVASN